MKPSDHYKDPNPRESPYMPTLTTKSPVLLQNKLSDNGISRDLMSIYLKLRKKREMVEKSQHCKKKKTAED